MRDVTDRTPAYAVQTTATNCRGAQFGNMHHVITRGQLAQHALHLEPDARAAARIAEGAHNAYVRTTDRFKAQLVDLPVNVQTISTVELPEVRISDVVAISIGGRHGSRHYDVVQIADAMAQITPVDPDDTRDPQWIGLDQLARVLDSAAFRQILRECGRLIDGTWHGITSAFTSNCTDHRHDLCTGWIAPLTGARECMCLCHDEARMSYPDARVVTQDRVAGAEYAQAVEAHHDHGHDAVVEAADAWVARRLNVRALGVEDTDGANGLAALPAELAEALALIERAG